jgi:hypothetical protein
MLKRIPLSKGTLAAAAAIHKLYVAGKVFEGLDVRPSLALREATKRFDKGFARDLAAMLEKPTPLRGVWGFYLHNLKREIRVPLGNGYCGVGVHDYGAGASYYIGVVKCSAGRGGV